MNWNELNLRGDVVGALNKCGYLFPTEIQYKSINTILSGSDFVGGSATGSGKTLCFGLPAIQKIDTNQKGVQVLIVCPTRELAMQVCDEIKKVANIIDKAIKVVPIYGGADFARQVGQLVKGAKIVVGTPGRVLDHLERKSLKLKNCDMLILDEADEMLSMGFRPDIEKIIAKFKAKPQMLLFSATMPNDILMLIDKYLQEPKYAMIKSANKPSENVKQFYTITDNKLEVLEQLVKLVNKNKTLVFCNTKAMTEHLSKFIKSLGLKCDMLNGDMNQQIRKKVLDSFREGKIQFLVCTDVASRGLDIDNLNYVINYDLPKINEWYIHRIGRTGRNQNKGRSYTLLNRIDQLNQLKEFAKDNNFILNEYRPISSAKQDVKSIKNENKKLSTKKAKNKILEQKNKPKAKIVNGKISENLLKNGKKTVKNTQKSDKFSKNTQNFDIFNKKQNTKNKRAKEKKFINSYDYDGMSEEEFNNLFKKK